MIFLLYPAIIIATALIQTYFFGTPIIESFLQNALFVGVGVFGIVGFIQHGFRGDQMAKYIGWPPGSPFQRELAYSSLGMGICGILCAWTGEEFWLATIIVFSVFLFGCAYGHIVERFKSKNKNPGNSGLILYYDILMPLALIGLLIAYHLTK